MSLVAQAELDLGTTLEDPNLFGVAIKITDPSNVSADLFGRTADIGQVIDPETEMAVSARDASCALRLSSLLAVSGFGGKIPENSPDDDRKPWLVEFVNGTGLQAYKVRQSFPDRKAGVVRMSLEFWNG